MEHKILKTSFNAFDKNDLVKDFVQNFSDFAFDNDTILFLITDKISLEIPTRIGESEYRNFEDIN